MFPADAVRELKSTFAHATASFAHQLHDSQKRADFVDTMVRHCIDFAQTWSTSAPTPAAGKAKPHLHIVTSGSQAEIDSMLTPHPPPPRNGGANPHSRPPLSRAVTISEFDVPIDAIADATPEPLPRRSTKNCPASPMMSRPDSINYQSLAGSHNPHVSGLLQLSMTADGDKMINGYVVIATLGRGSMGKVKLAVHSDTDEVFAIKILNKSLLQRIMKGDGMTALTQVQQEVAIMKKLNHRNVVKMHEVIDDPEKNKMYIVMDYVAGGQLFELEPQTGACPVMPVHEIRGVMRQLCAGLMYLHRHGIVHRDIKPDNILIDRTTGSVFLSDFGVSEICGDKGLMTTPKMEGTPMYMAPEMYRVDAATSELDGECLDVWAWGVTLYCMLYGKHPFMARTVAEARDRIVGDELKCPREPPTADAKQHPALWHALVDLLETMLHRDPTQRATMKDVRTALRGMKVTEGTVAEPECCEPPLPAAAVVEVSITDIRHSISLKSGDIAQVLEASETSLCSKSCSQNVPGAIADHAPADHVQPPLTWHASRMLKDDPLQAHLGRCNSSDMCSSVEWTTARATENKPDAMFRPPPFRGMHDDVDIPPTGLVFARTAESSDNAQTSLNELPQTMRATVAIDEAQEAKPSDYPYLRLLSSVLMK